jgi:hypothetical protein
MQTKAAELNAKMARQNSIEQSVKIATAHSHDDPGRQSVSSGIKNSSSVFREQSRVPPNKTYNHAPHATRHMQTTCHAPRLSLWTAAARQPRHLSVGMPRCCKLERRNLSVHAVHTTQ